jgi:hypothetical protein
MLFEIDENSISAVQSSWTPREVDLEKYIVTSVDTEVPTLDQSVFGEPLLLISNQVRTRRNRRADILAIDRAGNGVIVELKRDRGLLGVETQALQYLSDFASYKGSKFICRFSENAEQMEGNALSFMGGSSRIDDINNNSRIILLARGFDPTIYSMGEWLSNHGVSFRCIEYTPVEIENRRFLSFSVAFDRSPEPLFPIAFSSSAREPGVFWHNIARADNEWWNFLVQNSQIPACFSDEPGDQGEKILTSYISGDLIVAYATRYGAVGWGVIENPSSYKLLRPGDSGDKLNGSCLHRVGIKWKATVAKLSDGISPDAVRQKYGIYHPLSTSVSIDKRKSQGLINELSALSVQA